MTDPCWKGYKQLGLKNKKGKQVPNCVPVKEESEKHEKEEMSLLKRLEKKTDKLIVKDKAVHKKLGEETITEQHKDMHGKPVSVGQRVGFKSGTEQYGKVEKILPTGHAHVKVYNSDTGDHDTRVVHVKHTWCESQEEYSRRLLEHFNSKIKKK